MAGHDGFRHNAQVLRVVDLLERRSPAYPGLNLTRELRESLLKHETGAHWPAEFGPRPRHPCLEAQVVDLADSTAYDMHDIEDGLYAGMFREAELEQSCALWRVARAEVEARHPSFLGSTLDTRLRVKRIANQLIKACINDLIRASAARIAAAGVAGVREVRSHPRMLVGHGPELLPQVQELQAFLQKSFYGHPYLLELSSYARALLARLFEAYRAKPAEMSPWYRGWAAEVGLERAVCDYLAGMTDRFAEGEHARLVGRRLEPPQRSVSSC
jgi:dGTPase